MPEAELPQNYAADNTTFVTHQGVLLILKTPRIILTKSKKYECTKLW